MKHNTILIILAVAVISGAGGFFAGKYTSNNSGTTGFGNSTGGRGYGGSGAIGARNGGVRPVTGQILNSDAQSITVKLSDGSTKIVLLTSSTQINQATNATKNDLKSGVTVAAFGTTNTDGSVTAQSVQINPQEMRRGPTPTANQ